MNVGVGTPPDQVATERERKYATRYRRAASDQHRSGRCGFRNDGSRGRNCARLYCDIRDFGRFRAYRFADDAFGCIELIRRLARRTDRREIGCVADQLIADRVERNFVAVKHSPRPRDAIAVDVSAVGGAQILEPQRASFRAQSCVMA